MYSARIGPEKLKSGGKKLHIYFCQEIAIDHGWKHKEELILEFEGWPGKWKGTVGIKKNNKPYMHCNVRPVSDLEPSSLGGKTSVTSLLCDIGLSENEYLRVNVLDNNNLQIRKFSEGGSSEVAEKSVLSPVVPGFVSHEFSKENYLHTNFPFGDKKEILRLAKTYWQYISGKNREAEKEIEFKIVPNCQDRGYLTDEDFEFICSWKSPRPKMHRQRNTSSEIARKTHAALSEVSRSKSLDFLVELKGVRLRTATAVMHWFRQHDTPILDYRVIFSLGRPEPSNYEDMLFYDQIADEIIGEAKKVDVSLREMDRALWVWDKIKDKK
ncbi:hypothetical protein EV659_11351 [Rhodothalassium salexigens DSM 2132]|uniref:Uncharacterized protein n=1 Tax=Rhodothalassium salexigens DSM 2132 TaxID=1188247 RepID=A0A4R2P8Y7_RHOSA|nr:hypothetical protein [Rhodothalassium salexigens]MBB4212604.1 hypothetical protein [Rhodothalassium salexigens DSM 2132]TCP30798.1 hypothetical protein EV659_11351 [Rhodothalassium salexigens DSM 2132]